MPFDEFAGNSVLDEYRQRGDQGLPFRATMPPLP